jgi:hypothetical protein
MVCKINSEINVSYIIMYININILCIRESRRDERMQQINLY